MKRSLITALLLIFVFISVVDAQPRKHRTRKRRSPSTSASSGKIPVPCPTSLSKLQDCPDTGCGPSLDPNLNKQKNIRTDSDTSSDKDFHDLASLPDPVSGFAIGDTREKLTALGEGKMIRVVAWALIARKGSKESCNCGLSAPADTDNDIVLVDPVSTNPTLAADEPNSQTAEFAPRVRLDHPKLVGADLES